MAQIYNPNAAATFNKLIQSGLSTADAAQQAGITPDVAAQYALGNNNNLGSLNPGVGAAPATEQSIFSTQVIPQALSGQPAQGVQLASAAPPVSFGTVNADGTITFLTPGQDQTGPATTTARPAISASGQANAAPVIAPVIGTGNVELLLIPAPPLPDRRVVSVDVVPVPVFNTPGAAQLGQGGTVPTAAPEVVPDELSAYPPNPLTANVAEDARFARIAAPAPVQADDATGVDQQVADIAAQDAAANQSAAEDSRLANQEAAAKFNTTQQATLQSTYKQPGNGDWRFRISLAEGADYLYKVINNSEKAGGAGGSPGILAPLATTNGVVFPYTPQVTTSYQAKYNTYDLVHSNYRGVFYQNSSVSEITVRGTFTAQDTFEAGYLLAVIHFFRSVTKMFYGQDEQRGAPPPLVYLTGLGDYQFNAHPAVVTNFEYSLPNDVDYIRANNPNNFGTDLLNRRAGVLSPPSNPLSAIATRLGLSGLFPGATPSKPSYGAVTNSVTNTAKATYVPTKIDINVSLLPVQTRDQISKEFSLKKFADGNLLRGGFW